MIPVDAVSTTGPPLPQALTLGSAFQTIVVRQNWSYHNGLSR